MKNPPIKLIIKKEIRPNASVGDFVRKNKMKKYFYQITFVCKESNKTVYTMQRAYLRYGKIYLTDIIEKILSNDKSFEILSFSEAPKFSLFRESHFKYIYGTPDGKLISIMKGDDNSASTEREFNALNQIKNAGLKTPNPELVEVIHKKRKVNAIMMDKIEGTFVDIAKIPNDISITNLILTTVHGVHIKKSEFNIEHLKRPQGSSYEKMTILTTVISGLSQIVKISQKNNFAINDLQIIIKQDGTIVIIDPLWAGSIEEITDCEEREEINVTYNRLAKVIKNLLEEKN